MEAMALTPGEVRIKFNHREVMEIFIRSAGIPDEKTDAVFDLLDRRDKLTAEALHERAAEAGIGEPFRQLESTLEQYAKKGGDGGFIGAAERDGFDVGKLAAVQEELERLDLAEWMELDPFIARGLAYYTGTVFELHEAAGKERAIAGGGRYDRLIELFGGPPTPAVGFAMGDVVIRLMLEDRGLLESGEAYLPRPDVFIINSRDDVDARPLHTALRRAGLHVRHSYRATRNVGKLLGEAGKQRARTALILGAELDEGRVSVKCLDSGEQYDDVVSPYTKDVGDGGELRFIVHEEALGMFTARVLQVIRLAGGMA
jgi:histidyl-tRNA synthetase